MVETASIDSFFKYAENVYRYSYMNDYWVSHGLDKNSEYLLITRALQNKVEQEKNTNFSIEEIQETLRGWKEMY